MVNIKHSLFSFLVLLLTTSVAQAQSSKQYVQPDDWAYSTLQELVEISGCSDTNFQKNQALVREEFAAVLNSCQQTIEQQIASTPENLVNQNHSANLQRLLKDFEPELVSLSGQIDTLQIDSTNLATPRVSQLNETTTAASDEQTEQNLVNSINQTHTEPSNFLSYYDNVMNQVNNVSQLRDVRPDDWAYEALRNLTENYGCIAGYPDNFFRGKQAINRYEFAAGLNACLQVIEEQIVENTANLANQEDLATLQRLQEEFAADLETLQTRFGDLEERTAILEKQQFISSTSFFPVVKIGGEVIFSLSEAFGGDPPGTGEANAIFNHLTRMQIVSTFSGTDRLRMELSAGNFEGFGFGSPDVLNTNTALLSFQQNTDNNIVLSLLEYRFAALNDRVVFTFRPVGFSLSSVLTANSPYFDAGRGAISRFGEASPLFKIGALDAGIGLDWLISNKARLQIAYGARDADNPGDGLIFGEDAHASAIQFLLLPSDNVLTGISYIYSYSPDGRLNTFTGSAIADASGFINQRSNIHAISGTLQWRISPDINFSTWGGIVGTYASATDAFAVSTNYAFSLGFPDLFKEGDLLAILFGQPPKLIDVGDFSGSSGLADEADSFHVEAFYRFKVNDNISITPGFFMVTNPGNIEDNNAIFVGTIRSTFRF